MGMPYGAVRETCIDWWWQKPGIGGLRFLLSTASAPLMEATRRVSTAPFEAPAHRADQRPLGPSHEPPGQCLLSFIGFAGLILLPWPQLTLARMALVD
jgi:hypothetical protein